MFAAVAYTALQAGRWALVWATHTRSSPSSHFFQGKWLMWAPGYFLSNNLIAWGCPAPVHSPMPSQCPAGASVPSFMTLPLWRPFFDQTKYLMLLGSQLRFVSPPRPRAHNTLICTHCLDFMVLRHFACILDFCTCALYWTNSEDNPTKNKLLAAIQTMTNTQESVKRGFVPSHLPLPMPLP